MNVEKNTYTPGNIFRSLNGKYFNNLKLKDETVKFHVATFLSSQKRWPKRDLKVLITEFLSLTVL